MAKWTLDWKTGKFAWQPVKHWFWIKKKDIGKLLPLLWAKTLALQAMEKPTLKEEEDPQAKLNQTVNPSPHNEILLAYIKDLAEHDTIWINTKTSISIEFHLKHDEEKKEVPLDKQIPAEYHKYLDVFNKEKADQFPDPRSWDHKIKLKEGFQPKSFKMYNLTLEEQIELDKFLKYNLEKGYIHPSQSPMGSPFFFVKKKDGKLRPCQDYRYLNEWTIKNAYPLLLIPKPTDRIKDAKFFSKLDVRCGYNNIWIKNSFVFAISKTYQCNHVPDVDSCVFIYCTSFCPYTPKMLDQQRNLSKHFYIFIPSLWTHISLQDQAHRFYP